MAARGHRPMTEPARAIDAEVSLIGAAMSGYPDLDELLELVEPADFYQPVHEEMWAAVARVHQAGNQPDPISVRVAMQSSRVKFDPARLLDMVHLCPLAAQAPLYAAEVSRAAAKRRIQEAGVRVTQIGSEAGEDVEVAREAARQAVDQACQGRVTTVARTLAQIMPGVVDIAEHGSPHQLPTGWPDVDHLLGGLAPGRLVLIGARPGVGKSLMGANLALTFALRHRHAVLFASLEMTETEVGQRLLANHAGVNLSDLMQGRVDERAWGRIAQRMGDLESAPLRVLDSPTQTVATIRREARNFQRVRDDLALVIVDYLQLVRVPEHRDRSRAESLAEVSRGLKVLARETGACVVAMAQVNRQPTGRSDGRPRQSDLRESGSLEADADQVVLLHQPDDDVPEIEVIVDKNRHGAKGVAVLELQGHYARLASTYGRRAP